MDKDNNSIMKQLSILVVAGLLVRLLGFMYRIPLTFMLGDVGNGYYSSGYYIYTFFLIMSSAGLPSAISKMVANRIADENYIEAHRIFKISMLISAILGGICMLLLFFGADILSQWVEQPGSKYAMQTLAPTVFIVSIMAVYRGYFQGMKNTAPTGISQFIEQVFNAIFSVLLAYLLLGFGLEFAAAGGTAGTGIGALFGLITLMIIYSRKKNNIKANFLNSKKSYIKKRFLVKEIFMTAMPIIAGTAIFSLTNIIDMKMVMSRLLSSDVFTESEATALYGQLSGKYVLLTTLPVSISTAIATASIPNIASLITKKQFKEVYVKINFVIKITMMICIPASIGLGILADEILLLLFPDYPDGGILLKIGSISIIFLALSQILTGVLQGSGKVFVPVFSAFLGAIVKIPISYVLVAIPEINVIGAVISTMCCYIVASSSNYFFLKNTLDIRINFKSVFLKPVISAFVMAIVAMFIYYIIFSITNNNTIGVIISILFGGASYFMVLLKIKGLSKDEIMTLPMGRKIIKFIK